MDRRGFLKLFAAAAPVAAIAPTYFFAPIGGWQSDVIHSPYSWDFGLSPRSNVIIHNIQFPQHDDRIDAELLSSFYDNFFEGSPFQAKLRAKVIR